MVHFDIKGVVVPVFTPFNDEGHLNLQIVPEYMRYLHQKGVQVILVGGTTGESMSQSLEEKREVLCEWLKAAKPFSTKVIAQVGGAPLPDVLKMAQYAKEFKADAILTLPELYFRPKNTEQLVSYVEEVAKAAPNLPLLYYHYPKMSMVEVNMLEFFPLASSRIPTFKGMKCDLVVAAQVADMLSTDQRLFIGSHLVGLGALLGHESNIATICNALPELVMEVMQATKSSHLERAKASQLKLNTLVTAITSQGEFVPCMKAAMELVSGIKVGPPRQPLTALVPAQKAHIAEGLKKLGYETIHHLS